MEKLQLGRKWKTDAEKPRMDPLMRALKALHSAGSPEAMTPEELEHQRRNQEILGRLTAPMAGMEYEELSIGTMPAAWTRLEALYQRQPGLFPGAVLQAGPRHRLRCAEL